MKRILGKQCFLGLLFIAAATGYTQDESSGLYNSIPGSHRSAFNEPAPSGFISITAHSVVTTGELVIGVPAVYRTLKGGLKQGWRLVFPPEKRFLLKEAAVKTGDLVRRTPELIAFQNAQSKYLEALGRSVSGEALSEKKKALEALQKEIEEDLSKAKGRSVYQKVDLDEVKLRKFALGVESAASDAIQKKELEELGAELERRQRIALSLSDERRFIADDMAQRFSQRAQMFESTDPEVISKSLAELKAEKQKIFQNLQTQNPIYSIDELRQFDKQMLDLEFAKNSFPASKSLVATTAKKLALEAGEFVAKNPPSLAAKTLSLLKNKGLKVLWVTGALMAAHDAAGRIYVWNVLDANPTLSPIYTGGWLWWKNEVQIPEGISPSDKEKLPWNEKKSDDENLVEEKPGEVKHK